MTPNKTQTKEVGPFFFCYYPESNSQNSLITILEKSNDCCDAACENEIVFTTNEARKFILFVEKVLKKTNAKKNTKKPANKRCNRNNRK